MGSVYTHDGTGDHHSATSVHSSKWNDDKGESVTCCQPEEGAPEEEELAEEPEEEEPEEETLE